MKIYLDNCCYNRPFDTPSNNTIIFESNANEQAIISEGVKYLTEKLGTVETEFFIFALKRDSFDYTEWRKEFFENAYQDGKASQFDNFLNSAIERFPQKSFGL